MVPLTLLATLLLILPKSFGQTLKWYGLEPWAKKPMISMFTGIFEDTLYVIGGVERSVTTLDLTNIYMNDYDSLLYQPDLNVKNAEWRTEEYWYTLGYGLFCNQSCTTQIDNLLYIIAPFRNISNKISNPNQLFIYDLFKYKFISTIYSIPRYAKYSCIVNNITHIFIIGGGDYSNQISIYDIENNKWKESTATLKRGRNNFGCSFDSNMSRIFVFGGHTNYNASTAEIEAYSLSDDEWEVIMKLETDSPTIAPTLSPTDINNTAIISNISSTESDDMNTTMMTTPSPTNGVIPVLLEFKRSNHNAVLNLNTSKIYIFGGGGCSKIDNICTEYRNLVEIFDTSSYEIIQDEALLFSGTSDGYSSLYYSYLAKPGQQTNSWFDGIFIIGGNTENVNATYLVQYRITGFQIFNTINTGWTVDTVSYILFIICGLLLFIIFVGWIYGVKYKKYTDTRLLSVLCWFLYLMDVLFDFAFNGHLWKKEKYGLASFSLFFILIRLIYSIGWQLRLGLKKWKTDITIRERTQEYLLWYMSPCCVYGDNEWLIYTLSLLSGSSHGLIHLLNSNLFGLSIFNMGLVSRHMIEYNLTRLPSGVLCGNIPQFIIQILYVLEWGSEGTAVLYAGLTSFISLCIGITDIFIYRHSYIPVHKLMLDEDFTKPYFLIFKSQEIYEIRHELIHKAHDIIDAISQMINVPPNAIEINLSQIVPKGVKISFVEYSGTKNASEIVKELTVSIDDGWFQSAIKRYWKLRDEPVIELWNEASMYEHKQLFTQDLVVNMRTLYQQYGEDGCCTKMCRFICCGCSCCHCCSDMIRISSMKN